MLAISIRGELVYGGKPVVGMTGDLATLCLLIEVLQPSKKELEFLLDPLITFKVES